MRKPLAQADARSGSRASCPARQTRSSSGSITFSSAVRPGSSWNAQQARWRHARAAVLVKFIETLAGEA
jgi:hypothetical protein